MLEQGTKVANGYKGIILERVNAIPEGINKGKPGYLIWWVLLDTGVDSGYNNPYQDTADNALKCVENTSINGNLGWVLKEKVHTYYTNWDLGKLSE